MILLTESFSVAAGTIENTVQFTTVTGAITYLIGLFFKYFYKDFLKEYWARKLKAINEREENQLGMLVAMYMLEGHYHLVARQLITVADSLSKRYADTDVEDNELLLELRNSMQDIMQKTRTALSQFRSRETGKALSLHLDNLTEKKTVEFYEPILRVIRETGSGDTCKLRNIILSQIDRAISEAGVLVLQKNSK